MMPRHPLWRPLARLAATGVGLSMMLTPLAASAQQPQPETTLFLRPHCTLEGSTSSPLGPLPTNPQFVPYNEAECPTFAVEDPQTLKTNPLSIGETLDIDVVVKNKGKKPITRVRSWLAYDPNILKGEIITMHPNFPVVTPGESGFNTTQGYAMMEGSVEQGTPPSAELIVLARVRFTVLRTNPAGTVISFYDVQRGGHTVIMTEAANQEQYILSQEPGVLHVTFRQAGQTGSQTSVASVPAITSTPTASTPAFSSAAASSAGGNRQTPDGGACITHLQCQSALCIAGFCQALGDVKIRDGGTCGLSEQCQSGSCVNNICAVGTATTSAPTSAAAVSSVATTSSTPTGVLQNGQACITSAQCQSGNCTSGLCQAPGGATGAAAGAACTQNADCQSFLCAAGVCLAGAGTSSAAPVETTAFTLLQVQRLRVTSEGSSVFLAWDPLQSSQLKGYNVYYGTTTGQYIQRKSVAAGTNGLALRALPTGTAYYFAIRAVNTTDEESAFSQEVGVTVGDPTTSTSPLAPGDVSQVDGNPLEGNLTGDTAVPGKTGASSWIAILVMASAAIGTFLAFRRQVVLSVHKS